MKPVKSKNSCGDFISAQHRGEHGKLNVLVGLRLLARAGNSSAAQVEGPLGAAASVGLQLEDGGGHNVRLGRVLPKLDSDGSRWLSSVPHGVLDRNVGRDQTDQLG